MNSYETDELLDQYMDFHYGPEHFDVPNYPRACAEITMAAHRGPRERALDLGCAVGRSSLELARGFRQVLGIDLSRQFVHSASQLATTGGISYRAKEQGDLFIEREADLNSLGLKEPAERVEFHQGDACALDNSLGQFDLILAGNLIDRLWDPAAFLAQLASLVRPDGLLAISSPYTLLPEHTPRSNWIGGFESDGQALRVLDGLHRHLSPQFVLEQPTRDIPFVIRETARKYQHTYAELSLWRRSTTE